MVVDGVKVWWNPKLRHPNHHVVQTSTRWMHEKQAITKASCSTYHSSNHYFHTVTSMVIQPATVSLYSKMCLPSPYCPIKDIKIRIKGIALSPLMVLFHRWNWWKYFFSWYKQHTVLNCIVLLLKSMSADLAYEKARSYGPRFNYSINFIGMTSKITKCYRLPGLDSVKKTLLVNRASLVDSVFSSTANSCLFRASWCIYNRVNT